MLQVKLSDCVRLRSRSVMRSRAETGESRLKMADIRLLKGVATEDKGEACISCIIISNVKFRLEGQLSLQSYKALLF